MIKIWPRTLAAVVAGLLFAALSCADESDEFDDIRSQLDDLDGTVVALQDEVAEIRSTEPVANEPLDDRAVETTALADEVAALAAEGERVSADLEDLAAKIDALDTRLEIVDDQEGKPQADGVFTLQLLHAGDMDGSSGALGNVENFSAILDGFRKQYPNNTLVLSSGDNYVPGPRFYAAGDDSTADVLGVPGNGRGDIALLNAMGFQASAIGNHELDRGTGSFASLVASEVGDEGTYVGTLFPYLSSNLGFEDDENLLPLVVADGQEAELIAGSLTRSATITVSGERIGIVGATTPHLRSLTNADAIRIEPADVDDYVELAVVIQSAVDALLDQGIDKVILLAHMQQISIEIKLAGLLQGVDIVVAGGSNTLLADKTDSLRAGDEAQDDYPLVFESAVGEPILVVNTSPDYRYLGRLVVDFDERGLVIPESVDEFVSGAYSTETQGGQVFSGRPIPEVSKIVEALTSVMREHGNEKVGKTSVYLAGLRPDVRTQETNLGNLIADAFLWTARLVDPEVAVSLKNAGGIRDHIGIVLQPPGTNDPQDVLHLPPPANEVSGIEEGDISHSNLESVLRFNNELVILPLTATQLVEAMEHSIGFEGVGEVYAGRFPQVSGMRFSFDPSRPEGQRVDSLAVVNGRGEVIDRVVESGELIGDAERVIKMVTTNFTANGGDDYPFPVPLMGRVDLAGEAVQFNAPDPDFPDTNSNGVIDGPAGVDPGLTDFAGVGSEQDALSEYLARFYGDVPFDEPETTPLRDRRIQDLGIAGKQDTVFE